MTTLQWIAIGAMLVGIVNFAVGGFIDVLTNPHSWDDRTLRAFRHGGRSGLDFGNPKARPWGIPGLILLVCGLILLVAG
ncbi:MAG: hypothetical protein E5V65_12840 [Mesorhizobium sp.]|nr:MAG: hypothetical protein E5V65_12840 [Mesorhizobium sp.]